ncbi:Zn-dependent hydrolase [Sporosarcina newyorkensis]|uniref:N-carbamoyl-L-amino-acid hydrolase n=2 Tax=Sporosarcina newyorkensis TaxID=759851 RepID=A0A1T4Y114_9BACL|nr:Zn-dependent hydrolase [Sporosarcina newyorkensis]EGQ26896.1 allantoate amidohydrolase [Sporosarcina newyorkensis 2681]SKA95178.1 N-carbamoyl-L-amino-acid hydrolase [Sporosarcina newyorkensis]
MAMQIQLPRLVDDLESYAMYGRNERGGITRPSFSREDLQVRMRFIKELQDLGLEITVDGIANIWGRLKGSGKKEGSIVIGSHLDTVPNGGKYDGALGTLVAKEIIRTIIEKDITLDHDLEIVSFTAEESNDFGLSTLGSRAFVGMLTEDELRKAADSKGLPLSEALETVDGDINRIHEMATMHDEKKAFVEMHIEQGKRLESNDKSVAIINSLVGVYRSKVTVMGEANHSGTTMMPHRSDALTATAEMILAVEKICGDDETDLVGTVGKLDVQPNAINIIPGQIDFVLEIRGECQERMDRIIDEIEENWRGICKRRDVQFKQSILQQQEPTKLDEKIVSMLQKSAEEMSVPYMTFTSMAIHDAANMSRISRSSMIFVKSIDGKSHCPEEYSTSEDIKIASDVMLNGILAIDRQLD